MTDKPNSTGQRLKDWGQKHFSSNSSFAEKLNITEETLQNYFTDKEEPTHEIYEKLRQYGCNTAWLRTGMEAAFEPSWCPVTSELYSGKIEDIPSSKVYLGWVPASPHLAKRCYGIILDRDYPMFKACKGDTLIVDPEAELTIGKAIALKLKSGKTLIGVLDELNDEFMKVSMVDGTDVTEMIMQTEVSLMQKPVDVWNCF